MSIPMTYLNAAGSSLNLPSVIDAQVRYLQEEQRLGGYRCANVHQRDWDALYSLIAELIHAQPHQVALQESASRAMQNALLSIPWKAGDEIVITPFEYGSNYVALFQLAQRYQLTIKTVPNVNGNVCAKSIANALTERTKAVMLTWVPSHNGVICSAAEVGEAIQGFGGYYVVDACQAVGQLPVDVTQIGCDFLTATGRKFLRGPRGTGFLYASDKVLTENLFPIVTDHFAAHWISEASIQLQESARRFELWEANWAARMGLKVALEHLLDDQAGIYQTIRELSQACRERLSQVEHIELCDSGDEHSAIITFRHNACDATQVNESLLKENIVTSMVTRDSGLIDMNERKLPMLNRASVHVYNTLEDVDRLAMTLAKLTG